MTAKEFNELTEIHVNKHLSPLGFKKSGTHFYIHKTPNIMVLYKVTFKGVFNGFCLALTHDFLPYTKDEKGEIKIPIYLENYPFSIPLIALNEQYIKHHTVTDFTYDANFISREVLTTRKFTKVNQSDLFNDFNVQQDRQKSELYVKSAINIVESDGMKLLNEYSPVASYLAVTRHQNSENMQLNQFKLILKQYLTENNIEIPKRKTNWFKKLFNN